MPIWPGSLRSVNQQHDLSGEPGSRRVWENLRRAVVEWPPNDRARSEDRAAAARLRGGSALLALLGFEQGGRAVAELAQTQAWRAVNLVPAHVGTSAENAWLGVLYERLLLALAAAFALVVVARSGRGLAERLRGTIRLSCPRARMVRAPRGFSILEASLMVGIPRACICGGRARCSTCRVRVIGHAAALPPPSETERAVLRCVRAEPSVRLACQLRPLADAAIIPLVPPDVSLREARSPASSRGEERFIAVVVVDMRDSTQLAVRRLPFDAVLPSAVLSTPSGARLPPPADSPTSSSATACSAAPAARPSSGASAMARTRCSRRSATRRTSPRGCRSSASCSAARW